MNKATRSAAPQPKYKPKSTEINELLSFLDTHPLDKDLSAQLQNEAPLCQDSPGGLRHLDASTHTCAVHAAGQVDSRPPDVVLWLGGADNTGNHWPVGDTCSRSTEISDVFPLAPNVCMFVFLPERVCELHQLSRSPTRSWKFLAECLLTSSKVCCIANANKTSSLRWFHSFMDVCWDAHGSDDLRRWRRAHVECVEERWGPPTCLSGAKPDAAM